jgi:hypothetical protein
VGRTDVIGASDIEVYIDDFVTSTGAGGVAGANRTWYDGLGYALVDALAPLPGDFDGNGFVDGLDLAQWQGDYLENGDSDADGDGDSDGQDFLIWQQNLTPLATAATTAEAVPEPAASVLVLFGSMFLLNRQRRRGL